MNPLFPKRRQSIRFLIIPLLLVIQLVCVFIIIDRLYPLPEHKITHAKDYQARTVLDKNGDILRTFADQQGIWRYPTRNDKVSANLLEALLGYEDRWFYYHPGINPFSLLRAAWQYLKSGEIISGGSTISMQVARLLDPHQRSLSGKLQQMFRALQLERKYNKQQILDFYLNYAPYGGTIEGVQAASLRYFGRDASQLSDAQAALLAVLPQAPSRLRPDRHTERALRARNKVIQRLLKFKLWNQQRVNDALNEPLPMQVFDQPMLAPLLAQRLVDQSTNTLTQTSLIDPVLQASLQQLAKNYAQRLLPQSSLAILLVENKNLAVRAYIGTAEFANSERFGHIDMVRAYRSPGSTLKPFLYAQALDDGLIHSHSLLLDAPLLIGNYRPANFSQEFIGPVSATEALQRSLNVPAVDLLSRLGSQYFDSKLRQGGLHLRYPANARPNLSLILGGTASTLEQLTAAYSAMARGGLSGTLRYHQHQALSNRRLMSEGAAFIVREMLKKTRPGNNSGQALYEVNTLAWKTGTSYGYRDAWAIGVNDQYSIGIWTGRPDGTPSPGHYGAQTAAPLLFLVADQLQNRTGRIIHTHIPDNVTRREICWPLGIEAAFANDPLCHEKYQAWVLDGVIPPTLKHALQSNWAQNPVTITLDKATGLRLNADCMTGASSTKTIALWPLFSHAWLTANQKQKSNIPELHPLCQHSQAHAGLALKIIGIDNNSLIHTTNQQSLPGLELSVQGGSGEIYWLLNNRLIANSKAQSSFQYQLTEYGDMQLSVIDSTGMSDKVRFRVR